MKIRWLLLALLCPFCTEAHALTLVEEGRAGAVIVVADEATLTARYAAEELAQHVKKATGVDLPIAPESEIPAGYPHRVYVGITEAAHARGLAPEPEALRIDRQPDPRGQMLGLRDSVLPEIGDLKRDGFVLRTHEDDLFVYGFEDPALDRLLDPNVNRSVLFWGRAPRVQTPPQGTLYGVYELLHRYAGVRWLWPGELGTQVPQTDRLIIEDALDETHEPGVMMRNFNFQGLAHAAARALREHDPRNERIGFTREGLQRYHRDLAIFLARHRIGRTTRYVYSRHEFSGWWERLGDKHPEWFMQNENGERGPMPGGQAQHVALCVSNPDLQRYIIDEHWRGPGYDLALGEVDRRGMCLCSVCRSWDPPRDDIPSFVRYDPVTSNRYARFWNRMADGAVEKDPDTVITTFLYWNYMPAPVGEIKLNPNIYGLFVPWSDGYRFYPMSEETDHWLREQWLGWHKTGIRMAYRPNTFHAGYVMPYLNMQQAGEFFRFAYAHGMEGFSFDSLFGYWATRGPMLYMFMRLAWRPDLEIDAVLAEYYDAFGPAAEQVREYFEYWEQYASIRPGGGSALMNPLLAPRAFPYAALVPAAEQLDKAMAATHTIPNPVYAERVAFLQKGLTHAKLTAQFMATLDRSRIPDPETERFRACQAALRELIAFRRATENEYVSDLHHAARQENSRVNVGIILDGMDEVGSVDLTPYYREDDTGADIFLMADLTGEWKDPFQTWVFRKDPEGIGLNEAWQKAATDAPGWMPIDVPRQWAQTWAGGYLGYGWYQTTFEWDETMARPLVLLFEGVDEQAWVFINGKLAGEHTVESENASIGALWNSPFVVQVPSDLLKPGENVMVVRVHASTGNGGIWKPVRAFRLEEAKIGL